MAVQGERAHESGQWTQRSTAEVIRHHSPQHTARRPDYESIRSDARREVASVALGMHDRVENEATSSSLAMALNVHIGLCVCDL